MCYFLKKNIGMHEMHTFLMEIRDPEIGSR